MNDNNNRQQVFVRSAMNDKVIPNAKIKQESFADLDVMDANVDPCNVDRHDNFF